LTPARWKRALNWILPSDGMGLSALLGIWVGVSCSGVSTKPGSET
jgi:hypothetical protein